jgi:hypothetical protein
MAPTDAVADDREMSVISAVGSDPQGSDPCLPFALPKKFPRHCYHQRKLCTLPWVRCRHCGRKLARYDVVDRQTCIRVGQAVAVKLTLVCICGAVRTFHSQPV